MPGGWHARTIFFAAKMTAASSLAPRNLNPLILWPSRKTMVPVARALAQTAVVASRRPDRACATKSVRRRSLTPVARIVRSAADRNGFSSRLDLVRIRAGGNPRLATATATHTALTRGTAVKTRRSSAPRRDLAPAPVGRNQPQGATATPCVRSRLPVTVARTLRIPARMSGTTSSSTPAAARGDTVSANIT